MAVNSGARVWGPFKELYHTVEAAIHRRQPDAIQDLDIILRKHKTDFISLLRNPAKNRVHREAVKKADIDGIAIQGQQGTQVLTKTFIEEALIVSDLFDLNEYAAVELLMAGENQQPYFPGLPRGLVAVVLYYDGRVSLVNSLRTLIQAREGRTWTLGIGEELQAIVTKFTDQLMAEGLTAKILELLRDMDITKDITKLEKERALGHARHRKQVTDLMKEVQQSLAECLFCWTCQTPLNKSDTLLLMRHLQLDDKTTSDGKLDSVTMALVMALLYSLDVRILEQEDVEDVIQRLPIIADDTYVQDVHREVISAARWANPGLKGLVQLAWSCTLRAISQYPNIHDLSEFSEQDEFLVDTAMQDNVLAFIRNSIIATDILHKEEFYLRQLHNLVADFLVQMPLKVKELRNRGDETARIILAHQQEGLEPPTNLPRDFENLLYLIGDLYGKDPLGLELALEYWCPPEPQSASTTAATFISYNYRPPQRQISLYKFMRHAGDLLPPSLYIPYIHMLTGLANGPQCAHHCFNLLKTNGMAGGQVSSVSWDHFFVSMNQYYSNLRQEAPVTSDMAHVYRHHPRGITPQEVEGLAVVLRLTRTIAEQDEAARLGLCENQQWLPVVVILGLVSCSVPPSLKAELLLSLNAFAKTPEIATTLWQSLEVSQILPTVSATTVHQPGGIQVELDEVEARNEEFPMTIAFLKLIDTLTDVQIPAALGVGYRAPGFEPYLEFLRESVFLKFNTRAYKNPAQKWEVGACVLSIMNKLLSDHEVMLEDFYDQYVEVQGSGTVLANKPPGHSIMVHMLNDSSTFRMVLYIIDEATKLLDKFVNFPGKPELERAGLLCLKMIAGTFEKQEAFLTMLRESASSIMVSQIDRLLLSINPRSGRPDHVVNVAKYVTYNSFLAEHALYAVRILCWICQSPLAQPELVGLFTASQTTSIDLLHGFVECLEVDDPEDVDQTTEDEDVSSSQIRNATRQSIMQLLLHTIDQPAPNLAHFLLGFELRKPVNKTNLQDPGVLGSARTCLHSILSTLDRGVGVGSGPTCLTETPQLARLAYQMIYVLCANKDTSSPTMRYLRTAHDFLDRHVQQLPFNHTESGKPEVGEHMLLSQQSWLLKAVAIELRLTSVNRQRSHTQRLLNLLLDDMPSGQQKALRPDGTYDLDFMPFDMDMTGFGSMNHTSLSHTVTGGQARRKILSLLDSIDLSQQYTDNIQLEFFEASVIEQVIQSCEQKNQQGFTYCNVKMLHRMLMSELNNLQGAAAAGQRPLIAQEIQSICANVVERNTVRECVFAKRQALEAWRQVLEIILTACPDDLLHGEHRQNVLFELIQDLLLKVSDEEAVPELTAPVAGVILTLVSNLRQCFITDQSDLAELHNLSQYVTMLDGAMPSSASQSSLMDQGSGVRTVFSSSLQVVLKGLIEHIMRSSSGAQRVRANLYGALLYYLQIADKPKSLSLIDSVTSRERGVGAVIVSKESEYERLVVDNLATISSYGENFMEVICRDAADGHDVGKMLALATLDSILKMDVHGQWLSYMASKGYVDHIVKSLLQDDEQLQAMLNPNPEPLKALYIYESKMGVLTRVAHSASGAHTLLQSGLMVRLAECVVYDMRPDIDRPHEQGFIPSVMQRYRQLLFPVLKLCLATLTSLGIENRTAAQHVLQFIVSHVDVFMTVLRDRQVALNLPALEELALTTATLSRAALNDVEETQMVGDDKAGLEIRGHVSRLQRQMIALLPRYCLSGKLLRQVQNLDTEGATEEGRDLKSRMTLAIEEVASNVVSFCRNLISKSATNAQLSRLLFGPSLIEAVSRDLRIIDDYQSSSGLASRPPNLGIVVFMLRQSTNHFQAAFDAHKQNLRKMDSVTALSSEELKELCGGSSSEKLSSHQRHQMARRRLLDVISLRAKELQHLAYIIENCVFILWRHLDFYLLHCVPSDQGMSLYQLSSKKSQQIRKLHGGIGNLHLDDLDSSALEADILSGGFNRDELESLKVDAVSCINDTLLKKLQEIDQCYIKSRTRYGFMEALIRRLKRLLKLHTSTKS